MTEQLLLDRYSPASAYPESPGYKVPGPSEQAARSVASAETLRAQCLECLRHRSLTADEVASALGESILSCRPRLSELRAKGLIRDTGTRRANRSGKSATVWRAS